MSVRKARARLVLNIPYLVKMTSGIFAAMATIVPCM